MSIERRIVFGASASWISRITNIVLGILLMPILFRHLPREELGVWLLLGQSWATLGILDLGLGVTITRRIAFAVGKASSTLDQSLLQQAQQDIADLVETGRRLYLGLAVLAFLVASLGGFFSLGNLHLSANSLLVACIAWVVLCVTQAFSVWASIWTCLLQGAGYVGWDALSAALIGCLTLAGQIAVASFGTGLMGLAIVAAIGAIAQRYLIVAVARRKSPGLFTTTGTWQTEILASMASPALKAWVTSVGIVIVLNSDQFFIAGLRGAGQIPEYRAAYIIFLNLNMLAVTLASSSTVFIAQLWKAQAICKIHGIVTQNLRLGLLVMATGGGCVLGLGPHLFTLWIGHDSYIGTPIASIFFALLTLEATSFIIATSSRATEDEAFAVSTSVAAVLKIVLSMILAKRYGLIGVAIGTLAAQLLTNHWFMCYKGLRRLRMGILNIFVAVVAPAGAVFILTLFVVKLIVRSPLLATDLMSVCVGAMASGTIFATSIWLLVLDLAQKRVAMRYPVRILRTAMGL